MRASVIVPAGGRCDFDGATVRDDVTVGPGGEVDIDEGTDIRGSVTATQPYNITIVDGSVVRGSVTVTGSARVRTSSTSPGLRSGAPWS